MNWLQTVLALLQLAPQILNLIVAIEGVFGTGKGVLKAAAVMAAIPSPPPEVAARLPMFISSSVNALNAAGVFKHTAAPEKASL